MELLKRFYVDEHTRNAVQEFVVHYLREKSADMAFNGENTNHIKLARDVINEAWNKLEQIYGNKEEVKKKNPAR
jgi:hypothetical protein